MIGALWVFMLRSLIFAQSDFLTGTKAHPNSLINYFSFLASLLFPFHLVVMKHFGDTDAERFLSLSANSIHSHNEGRHTSRNMSQTSVLWGAFLNTSCGKVLRLLGADIRDISAWAPCLYLGLESPAAAACHTRLRSFTPLTPACSVNTVAVCVCVSV